MVSFYNDNKEFQFNTDIKEIPGLKYTNTIYIGDFIKPKFDEEQNMWYESATIEEIEEADNNLTTLAAKYAMINNYNLFSRDIDIPLDILEFFKPKEKIYNLIGEPYIKSYIYLDSGEEINVCDIIYEKIYEDITYSGITKNEFVKSTTTFRFYTKKDKSKYKEKVIDTLPFYLIPTIITENDVLVDVLWSSVKREEVLRDERYKAEQVMKTFNAKLYKIFTAIFTKSYQKYKETGDKSDLIFELNNPPNVLIDGDISLNDKLNEQVTDEDKLSIGLPIDYNITIKQLILNSLR